MTHATISTHSHIEKERICHGIKGQFEDFYGALSKDGKRQNFLVDERVRHG